MKSRNLESILNHHIASVKFVKKTNGSVRYMMCTRSKKILLNHPELGYTQSSIDIFKPRTDYPYNSKSHENVVVWDLMSRDVRQIWARTCVIEKLIHEDDFKGLL